MKTKVCSNPKCLQPEKPLSEFFKKADSKDGYRSECKKCKSIADKQYNKKHPWKQRFINIKARCENPNNKNYKNYGLRGVKCLITEEEIKFLWFRDKAYNMKKPSIDRIDNDGNYTFDNCQFIEKSLNSKKDKKKSILQYSLNDKFIKEWESIIQTSSLLKINNCNIGQCANGKRKTAGGYKWRYKEKIK